MKVTENVVNNRKLDWKMIEMPTKIPQFFFLDCLMSPSCDTYLFNFFIWHLTWHETERHKYSMTPCCGFQLNKKHRISLKQVSVFKYWKFHGILMDISNFQRNFIYTHNREMKILLKLAIEASQMFENWRQMKWNDNFLWYIISCISEIK